MRDVPDEPLEVTAERELIEEAGFSAGRMEYLTHFFSSAGMTDSVLHIYLATDLSPVPREMHGPEETHMEVLRLPLAEAVEMVARGEINDAKTVIGLLLVDRRLRE
jgi:ADP-ribose pyrophosphatase